MTYTYADCRAELDRAVNRIQRLEGGLRQAIAYIGEERFFDTQFLAMLQGILDGKPE